MSEIQTPLYTYKRAVGLVCNQPECEFETGVYLAAYEAQAYREIVAHYREGHGLAERIDAVADSLKAAGAIDGDRWKTPVVLRQAAVTTARVAVDLDGA